MFVEHLRDRNCTFCNGEGGYWEQGPNASTICTQCNTNWNQIRGYKVGCDCFNCLEKKHGTDIPNEIERMNGNW